MAKKQSKSLTNNGLAKKIGVATAAAAIGLPAAPAQAEVINFWGGGAGVFLSWGSGWNWGLEFHGNAFGLGWYVGPGIQVHFMKDAVITGPAGEPIKESVGPAIVVAGHAGVGFARSLVGLQLEAGLSFQSGVKHGTADHLGISAGFVGLTTSCRGSATRGEAAFNLGVSIDHPNILTMISGAHGRPLRGKDGLAALPVLNIQDLDLDEAPKDTRNRLATVWSKRAQQEWASVPAFQQLMEQLRANDAPESFVRRAETAGEDEVRHAVLAAGMVSKFTERTVALDSAETETREPVMGREGLKRLAVESWLDGCLGEGLAAVSVAEEAEVTTMPDVRAALQQIARDEYKHAELGWDILAWAVQQGSDVADAVRAVRNQTQRLIHRNGIGK